MCNLTPCFKREINSKLNKFRKASVLQVSEFLSLLTKLSDQEVEEFSNQLSQTTFPAKQEGSPASKDPSQLGPTSAASAGTGQVPTGQKPD